MKKITVIHTDNTSAVYIDGKLFLDSTSVNNPIFSLLIKLVELRITIDVIEFVRANEQWLALVGAYPEDGSDVVLQGESFEVLNEENAAP